MKCISKKSGFTLAELMVVVAILGILVTISIVVFGNHSGESEKAVCDANKTAWMQYFDMEEVNGLELIPTVANTKDIDAMLKNPEDSMKSWECPSGGKYSIAYRDPNDPNSWYIHCDVHDEKVPGGLPVFGADGGIVKEFISELNANAPTGNIDSTASLKGQSSDNVLAVLNMAEEMGIDPKSGLLTSWQYTSAKEILFSTVDIAQKEDGDFVPILRYNNNKTSPYYGTFTVWICKINNKISPTVVNINGKPVKNLEYMTFNSSGTSTTRAEVTGIDSLSTDEKRVYQDMKAIYDKVCEVYLDEPELIKEVVLNKNKMNQLRKEIDL